jgi:hypothetical protein
VVAAPKDVHATMVAIASATAIAIVATCRSTRRRLPHGECRSPTSAALRRPGDSPGDGPGKGPLEKPLKTSTDHRVVVKI